MAERQELMLFVDLLRLYQKYGKETFRKLSSLLDSPSFTASMKELLNNPAS